MTTKNTDYSILDTVLEQERNFLLEGNLEGLGTLLPVKEKLVENFLKAEGADRDQIIPLESKLQRNQLLLNGALDGIRAVAVRLAALRQVRTALNTYDAQGRKTHVAVLPTAKVEKRA